METSNTPELNIRMDQKVWDDETGSRPQKCGDSVTRKQKVKDSYNKKEHWKT
jgi:hypothetical protein